MRASLMTGNSAGQQRSDKRNAEQCEQLQRKDMRTAARQPNALTFDDREQAPRHQSPSGSANSAVISATDIVFSNLDGREPLPGDADRP